MTLNSSLEILEKFLSDQKIKTDSKNHLKSIIIDSDDTVELSSDIVPRIIIDAYDVAYENVKEIETTLFSELDIRLGRVQKEQLKKYLDYLQPKELTNLLTLINSEENNTKIKSIINKNKVTQQKIDENVDTFCKNLNQAINHSKKPPKNKKGKTLPKSKFIERIQDYLTFIYSRLVALNEKRKLSLKELFDNNKAISKYQFSQEQQKELEEFCTDDSKLVRDDVINTYNSKYLSILDDHKNANEKSAIIYLNISQKLFDSFKTKNEFYNGLFSFIKNSYQSLKNHHTLSIKISNIISNEINIKWEIYSYLTIFAEKFQKKKEEKQYFFPHVLAKNFIEFRHNIKFTEKELEKLEDFFKDEITFEELQKIKKISNLKITKIQLEDFRTVYSGFTFIDCSILLSKKKFSHTKELSFLENKNELLLLFFKHEIDPRKIPCPICASLKISGNSFPELGIRSWECKNPLCSQRSKTNRGKRYSARTIFMQNSTHNPPPENIISNELIAIWRKDVVENYTLDSLYLMLTKYFSQVGDIITIVDAESSSKFEKIITEQNRESTTHTFKQFVPEIEQNLFEDFFEKVNNNYISNFLYGEISTEKNSTIIDKHTILPGDCKAILPTLKEIDNMVTSPPYYNAREYTQWSNLYNYVHDMYHVALGSSQALKKGGVFFFNIGDIFDNENTTVTSKMGQKRIPLGAYIIFVFKQAGFELLDNVIWYKGEPQSNRHKNDGNNVPYYQRPANCYEHMFIFKKLGAKLKLNSIKNQKITNNLQKFIPVYKIVKSKGEKINNYGHTAPFPEDIPRISMLNFTKKGDVILDPFLGSGTTIFTSAKEDRIGVGIELNENYIKLSKKKIKEKTALEIS